jgi:hypothetical protein
MRIVRVHPSTPEGWALYPVLEQRAVAFMREMGPEGEPQVFTGWLRDCFINRAEILGAWMLLDEAPAPPDSTEPARETVLGHMLGWVDVFFGDPFVFVYQLQSEPGSTVRTAIHRQMIQELHHWIDNLNWAYEQARAPQRIRRVRFVTRRSERAWQGYLETLGPIERVRLVVTVKLQDATRVLAPDAVASVNGRGDTP